MNYEQITKTVKSTLVFVKNFVKDQLGAMVMFVALIIAAVAWGEYKHTQGKDESSDRISELEKRISDRNSQVKNDSTKILKLENKIDTLQNKLAMRDCTEEMERANRFLRKIEIENATRAEELRRRVEFEKRKTQEMLKMKENLKNNL